MNTKFWNEVSLRFLIGYLEHYKKQKEEEGLIPTIELLLEELKNDEK
jgi:hypothetical protein